VVVALVDLVAIALQDLVQIQFLVQSHLLEVEEVVVLVLLHMVRQMVVQAVVD
tara:strand:+ start:291 stop:449 length:159 start_codon:yes stop_codon:yes gene_type:complete